MTLFCLRRFFVLGFLTYFLLLFLVLFAYIVFPSSNYSKLRVVNPQRKLVLDGIAAPVALTNDCGPAPFVLQLVTSHTGNYDLRQRTRLEWNSSVLNKLGVRRYFLVGQTTRERTSADVSLAVKELTNDGKFTIPEPTLVKKEAQVQKDLIIGSFSEGYRHLTLKHLMGLRFALENCFGATFVIKQDDDIYVDLYGLISLLKNSTIGAKLLEGESFFGKVLSKRPVIRTRSSKWFVRRDELEIDTYPSFVSGWAYVTTVPAIRKILQVAPDSRQFWIDDVYITGILRTTANLKVIDASDNFAVRQDLFQCCFTSSVKLHWETAWCDFMFGPIPPPELRFQLIKHSAQCYHSGCKNRGLEESTVRTCVITMIPKGSEVLPKEQGQAVWEPIPIR